jgi:hypothetical protein
MEHGWCDECSRIINICEDLLNQRHQRSIKEEVIIKHILS